MSSSLKRGSVLRVSIILSGLILVGLSAGCDSRWRDEGGVVARVNGIEITLARLQEYYRPALHPVRTADEELDTLNVRLDKLIYYTLIMEAARADGMHKDPLFVRKLERHEKTLLNQLVKRYEIDETITVDNGAIEEFLSKSRVERHFQHIITLTRQSANAVTADLTAGEDWEAVALRYSQDSEVGTNRGDLGWLAWGEDPLALYDELQRIAYEIPVGGWRGPVEQGNEFHFVKVIEEREREMGSPEEEWQAAYSALFNKKVVELEQEMVDRVWREGGFDLDEDQFRWMVEKIQDSFMRSPIQNPLPVLTNEDLKRVVVSSRKKKWTVRMLLDELELVNPQARDNAVTLIDWRDRVLEWVITDYVANYARRKGYDRDPGFLHRRKVFIESALYAEKKNDIETSIEAPTDEELERYFRQNPDEFNMPETRRIVEVLVDSREKAEELLEEAKGGAFMETLAYEHTIRPDFKANFGRFAPIRRDQFGALGEAAFQTPEGELGPVVETPLGFSIFRVIQVNPPHSFTLDEVRDNLRARLYQEARERSIDSFVEQEWRRARIWKNHALLRTYSEQVAAATVEADSAAAADQPPADNPRP